MRSLCEEERESRALTAPPCHAHTYILRARFSSRHVRHFTWFLRCPLVRKKVSIWRDHGSNQGKACISASVRGETFCVGSV